MKSRRTKGERRNRDKGRGREEGGRGKRRRMRVILLMVVKLVVGAVENSSNNAMEGRAEQG